MPTQEELYDAAIQLQQEGKVEEAVGKLQDLVGESPDYALAHAALSVFQMKLDKFEEAVTHAKKVCELEAEDPFSFIAMSLICQKAGKLELAEQALAQAQQASMAASRKAHEKS